MLCHPGPLGDNTLGGKEGHPQLNICDLGALLLQTLQPALMDGLLPEAQGCHDGCQVQGLRMA